MTTYNFVNKPLEPNMMPGWFGTRNSKNALGSFLLSSLVRSIEIKPSGNLTEFSVTDALNAMPWLIPNHGDDNVG